jgi:hypothetical protein
LMTARRTRRRRSTSAHRAPQVRVALHPHELVVAKPRRALVYRADQQVAQTRHAPFRRSTRHRHPRPGCRPETRTPSIRLDQDRRPDPRLERPLLHTN